VDTKIVTIIGAGPAGIATAIQLKRCKVEFVLLEQDEIGGLVRNANLVENYPGFPNGVSGSELIKLFQKQLQNSGVKVSFEKVMNLEYRDNAFYTTTNIRVIKSTNAVIATGTKPKKLSTPTINNRIFYEVYPLRDLLHKRVAVIGAGDAAFDYAISLSENNHVIILNRNNRPNCIPLLMERCATSGNISYMENVNVSEINIKNNQLQLSYTKYGDRNEKKMNTDILLIAIGREPCLDFLGKKFHKNLDKLIQAGLLYMVGDVNNEHYRQTAIGVGDGLRTAMRIYEKIKGGQCR